MRRFSAVELAAVLSFLRFLGKSAGLLFVYSRLGAMEPTWTTVGLCLLGGRSEFWAAQELPMSFSTINHDAVGIQQGPHCHLHQT